MPVNIEDNRIILRFPYKEKLVDAVRALPDRKWDRINKYWWMPATPFHARTVIARLGDQLKIGADVQLLTGRDQLPKECDPDLIESLSVDGLKPYPFQAVVVPFLDRLRGRALIADEVGLGKTIEALIWARHRKIRRFLVVCPGSVLYKWQTAISSWYPEAGLAQVVPDGRTKITGDVVILSYDMLIRKDKELMSRGFELIIWDEFHKLKNYKTKRFQSAKIVSGGVPHILGLSGTPILNRPIELFNVLNMLDPYAWNFWEYTRRYCLTEKQGYQGAKNLPELEEKLRSIMIRRFKREVSDQLPAFQRTVVPFDLSPKQAETYRGLFIEDRDMIRREFPTSKGYFANTLDWLSAMRIWLERARSEPVIAWADDFLESADDTRKLVIYAEFRDTHRRLQDALYKWGTLSITGEVDQRDRQDIIDRWQSTTDERVMLLSSAGGEGIDLFGRGNIDSSTIVFAGRSWTPSQEEQVEGRLDRTGQQYPVEAVYPVASGTIDEDIHQLIEGKREVIRESVRLQEKTSIIGDLYQILERKGKKIITGGKHKEI